MHRSQPAPPPKSRSLGFRLEISRMVLFALLLTSAFLASMVHLGTVSKLDTFTHEQAATSHPGQPVGGSSH